MILNNLRTIHAVLASWYYAVTIFVKQAGVFYYRLLTNKIGYPRWLWLLMLSCFVVLFVGIVIYDLR